MPDTLATGVPSCAAWNASERVAGFEFDRMLKVRLELWGGRAVDDLPKDRADDRHRLTSRIVDLQVQRKGVLAQIGVGVSDLCDGADNDAVGGMNGGYRQRPLQDDSPVPSGDSAAAPRHEEELRAQLLELSSPAWTPLGRAPDL